MEMEKLIISEKSIIIQMDWHNVKNGEEFFLGVQHYGKFKNLISLLMKNGEIKSNLNIGSAFKFSERKLKVTCENFATKLFISPSVELSDIHKSAINCVDLSSSGKLIVTGDSDGSIFVWNAFDGKILRWLTGHLLNVNRCKFLKNENYIVTCSIDSTVRIWSIETGNDYFIMNQHQKEVTDFIIINEKHIISCSKDKTCKLFGIRSKRVLRTLYLDFNPLVLAFAHDLDQFICGLDNRSVEIYDFHSFKKTETFYLNNSLCTALFYDKNICYCGTNKGEIFCYDLLKHETIAIFKSINCFVHRISQCLFGLIVGFGNGVISFYPNFLKNFESNITLTGTTSKIMDFTLHKNETILFSVARDKIIRKYHLK